MNLSPRKIPVFVFPTSLKFYLSSRSTHKQLLTLYNPYDFPVRFKVLSTAPNKYSVIDPDGSIGPQACVDIVIRHNMATFANCNVTDKFRIAIHDQRTKQMGRRDIEAVLYDSEKDENPQDGDFRSVPYMEGSREGNRNVEYSILSNRGQPISTGSSMYIILVIGLISILILCIPSLQDKISDTETSIPTYLHISVQFKFVAAYVLGLVTTSLLRIF